MITVNFYAAQFAYIGKLEDYYAEDLLTKFTWGHQISEYLERVESLPENDAYAIDRMLVVENTHPDRHIATLRWACICDDADKIFVEVG